MGTLGLDEARSLFAPHRTYLNSATVGLPPNAAWDALQEVLAEWRHGTGQWEVWDLAVGQARGSFARLMGVEDEDVAVGAQVSMFTGLVAASLPAGVEVLCPSGEYTSLLFPFLVQADRGISVRSVPLENLAEEIRSDTHLVALSAVQSADGTVADLDAIVRAAESHGALTFVDASHACGWLPLDAGTFDFLVCAAYKWLLAPRGTAFCVMQARHRQWVRPQAAGWYAGEEPLASLYGEPLRLAASNRRLDVSPAWFSWVGAAPALALLEQVGVERIHANNVALANRFTAGLGLPPTRSAIVALSVDEHMGARLAENGIAAAFRAGRLRCSFHLYNTVEDVDHALDVLTHG